MIKVNLLDSVTERHSSAAVVEEKVANPAARFWTLGAAVCGVLALAMVFDFFRASQQGPVSLLSDINARLPKDPDFRLDTIEQKAGELTIEGQSPNETAVTQFGRSLEFSDGLFLNVSLEAERKKAEVNPADYTAADGPIDVSYKPEVFTFKIKCKYGPSQPPAG